VGLFAQSPLPENFHVGELLKTVIVGTSYEYTVYNGVDDAFTGATKVAIRIREGAQVKYTIRNGSIYFIDDDGKIQQTRYIRQAEMLRVTVSEEDLEKLADPLWKLRAEIPQVLGLKAPSPVTVPPSEPKPDTKKAEPKQKAKSKTSN
jgi:hypothetical protein